MLFIKTIESFLSKEECNSILNKFVNANLKVAKTSNSKSSNLEKKSLFVKKN